MSILPETDVLQNVAWTNDDHDDHDDHNGDGDGKSMLGDCDALEATRNVFKRVRFAATFSTSKEICKSDEVETSGSDSAVSPDLLASVAPPFVEVTAQ